MRIPRSSIIKYGTETDKSRVSAETRFNKKHAKKRSFASSTTKVVKERRTKRGLLMMNLENE